MSAVAGRRWPKAGQASPRPMGIRKDIVPIRTAFLKSPQRSTTDQSWKGRSFWSLKRLFSGKLSRNQDSMNKHCRKRHELKVNQHVCCGNHHIDKILAIHHPGQPKSNHIKSSSNPFPQQNSKGPVWKVPVASRNSMTMRAFLVCLPHILCSKWRGLTSVLGLFLGKGHRQEKAACCVA